KDLAETGHADGPRSGFGQGLLERRADAEFGDLAGPALAAGVALVAEAAGVVALVAAHVAETRDVKAVRAATVDDFVLVTLDRTAGADAEVVVHHVVPEFARAAAQAARPEVGSRTHEDGGGVEGRGAEEDNLRVELVG